MAADDYKQWLDIDFSTQPQYVYGDEGPQDDALCSTYEDSVPVLSDADIKAAIQAEEAAGGGADLLVSRIYNQKQEGSCVANACCQSHEIVQATQYGKDKVVHLSAISLYKRIGRSPGSGASVSNGLQELSGRGALPLDNPENRARWGDKVMQNTGFYEKFPADWENTANHFKIVEHHVIRSLEGMKTALVLGHPVVVGRQGHSICYCRLMLKGGRLVTKYANSWGNWGDNGFGYDSEGQMRMSAGWAFAVRTVKRELP
jgi:hypothetical protein